MKLLRLELHLYKPLMHNGVKHVVVDEFPSITVIAGENGSGKSSLLRECTPYPACRTDYDKGGIKKIVYEHNGSTYELTSDFGKNAGAHSFIKDGLELNESGTTEVQEDLVETYFEYNDIVAKLVSGKYNLCDMGKPDRKTLIMATYPSSLSFILEYHKVISSRMRAIGNNIKMLSQRELSLKGQLISATILNDYKKEREDLNKAITIIDTDIYTINKGIDQVNKALETVPLSILQQTPETFRSKLKGIEVRMIGLLKATSNPADAASVKILIEKLNMRKQSLESSIKENSKLAIELRNEIDKYEKYLSSDSKENIEECKRLIAVQDEIIANTPVNESVPVLSKTEIEQLKHNYNDIETSLSTLRQGTTPFWSENQYKNIELQLSSIQQSIGICNSSISAITESIQLLEVKRSRQARYTWPSDCSRVCQLRSSLEDIIKSIDNQIETSRKELEKLTKDRNDLLKEYEGFKTSLQLRTPNRQLLLDLESFFRRVSWGSYVLFGASLVDALNQDVSKIYNNVSIVLVNAENALKVKEARELKVALEAKLTNLESSAAPATQLIKESLIKKEAQLTELIEKITSSKNEIAHCDRENYNNSVYQNLVEETVRIQSDYNIWKKTYVLQQEIKEYRGFIETIMVDRMKIQNKLRELDNIITEQDNYLVRLNDEVLPELLKLQKEYDELAIVEAQISPTKGLPHIYLTKYINSILSLTNRFIARVWSYQMELKYLEDGEDVFDFSFPVILNGNSSVKDCNMCSNGQKSIINLCFTLAICIFRQYSLNYPITLDEISDGLSVPHASSLVTFLSEILDDKEKISQVCIVDHNVSIASSFCNSSKMVNLSKDLDPGMEWQQIGEIS